ncbi:MAG: YidC/Oxa1 family membrane protein insertase [Candidatus Endobugula sp.]|jgi:YidC/Oxa1 family membrane protein insertase
MKMDWQRTAYLSAIFVLGFLLIFEWSEFSKQQQLTIDNQKSTAVTTIPNDTSIPSIEQAASTIDASVDGELPSLPSNNTINSVAAVINGGSTSDRLIHINTDSFDLQIDKLGGDIVHTALSKHKVRLGGEEAYTILKRTANATYVAQSGIVGVNATDTAEGRPLFQSDSNEYVLSDNEDTLSVKLHLEQNGVLITKRFTFTRNDYLINVSYDINNQTNNNWQGNLYGQIKRDSHQPIATADSGLGVNPYLGAATSTPDDNYKKINFDDLADNKESFTTTGGWVAMIQHYFVSAWIPNSETNNSYSLRKLSGKDIYLLGFSTPPLTVAAGQQGTVSADFYVGPKDIDRLEAIAPYLDLTIDFGFLWWIAKPIFHLLIMIHDVVGNWGWSIIVLTLFIKIAFFYPSAVSYRSMARMRKLSPKMALLKERFGDDKQKMSQEMMKMYKTEKVNPMGGCLPILIQMPVFISLYWVLMESVELRHAPFALWITDLSVKDPFFVFPLIMGVTMFIQQKLNPTPPDPMQAKIMQWMPIAFTFMFLWFPAGLVIYWVTNNTLSIIQQYIITRRIEAED